MKKGPSERRNDGPKKIGFTGTVIMHFLAHRNLFNFIQLTDRDHESKEDERRRNLEHSCSLKATLTRRDGLPDDVGLVFATIQLHSVHPQAAKVLFSSQTSSLAIRR
jgi:hypothetical protein